MAATDSDLTMESWLLLRLRRAEGAFRECVGIDPDVRGGAMVLKGTRFPVSRLLAEIAEGASIAEIAADFALDRQTIQRLLQGMAVALERPVGR